MNLFCKPDDPILDLLHHELQANISRVPDGRLAPLSVLEHLADSRIKYRTQLPFILSRPTDLDLNDSYIEEKPMANISGEKTTRMDTAFGLKILRGFLQGFGVGFPNIDTYFKDTLKVSFSFENVKISWIDNGLLGDALKSQTIDRQNPVNAGFFADPPSKLLVVDAIITSSHFAMHVEETSISDFSINIQALKKELGKGETKLQAVETDNRTVVFKGKKPLPFAFTCLWIRLDATGRVVSMPPFSKKVRQVLRGASSSINLEKFQIKDPETPSLLDFD